MDGGHASAAITQDGQAPMDGANIEGDYTIRELDTAAPAAALHIWHTHFDTAAAVADINVVSVLACTMRRVRL